MTRIATRLSVIAHASTAALREAVFPGDEPLDSFGERDCAAIRLDWRPARILIAPELRARQTAAALGLAGEIAPALRDCDHGRWVGRSAEQIAKADPQGFSRWLGEPDSAPHGGESQRAFLERIAAWFGAFGIQPSHSVIVAHPLTLRAAIIHVLGAGADAFQRVDARPLWAAEFTGSTRWRFRSLGPLAPPPAAD
jgi:broad specificity phosphatase PhoE